MYEFPMGERYKDAQLSQFDFPEEVGEKINNWIKNPKYFLVFIGNPGIGKTHFLASLYNYYNRDKRIFYMNEATLFQKVRNVISLPGGDCIYEVMKMANYDNVRFWMIDDLGMDAMTEWQKEILTIFIDELYKNEKPAIFTSNIWTKEMDTVFSPRIQSRIKAAQNTIIELNWEDKRAIGL